MPTYQAVLLDAGFTILHIHPSWAGLFLRVARAHGMDFDRQQAQQAGKAAQAFFDAHYYRPNSTWASDDAILDFWKAYYRIGLEAVHCPPERLAACAEALAHTLNEPAVWRAYPEVPAVLAGLKEAGYTIGILSDWSSGLPAILQALGLQQYADFLVVSAVEGMAKPRPAFFLRALERAQVPADQALMVGDNLYADIQGAAQVGIRGILLDRHGWYPSDTVPTIRRLDALWGHLH